VASWIEENMAPDFSPETAERIRKIYDECSDEGEQKALEWAAQGSEPSHGTRAMVPFLFDANSKTCSLNTKCRQQGPQNTICPKAMKNYLAIMRVSA